MIQLGSFQGRVHNASLKKTYINRSIKVRGLYTARAKEGRSLTKKTFGYSKVGEGKQRQSEVNEIEAKIVKTIYDMYLRDVPLYKSSRK
jgi:hypothetical protein